MLDDRCDAPLLRHGTTLESRVLRKVYARFGEGRLEKYRKRQLASRLLYASMARDMELNGDIFTIELGHEVHIFMNH
jgi:hypothetical protein